MRLFYLFLVLLTIASAGFAEENSYLRAEKVFYDQENEIYIAEGDVEVMEDGKIIFADELTFYKATDKVFARGNVVLLEPSGEVFFGDELELVENFKKGVVENFTAKLLDNVTLMAVKAKKIDDNHYELEDAIYTPCKIHLDKDICPEWQLRAKKVFLDQEDQSIRYKHVYFQYGSIPIFYSPYLSHPTPNADRKSGFLTPHYGIISDVGTYIAIPYYFNIAPDKDLTLTTMITDEKAPIFKGEYRHLLKTGEYHLHGSGTYPKDYRKENNRFIPGHKFRGHIDGEGDFVLGDDWYNGFKVKRASDDVYLRTYGISDENYLTSQLYMDKVSGRNISYMETYSFQGLLDNDDPATSPLILPLANSHLETRKYSNGSFFSLDSNILVLHRDIGVQSKRLSVKGGYEYPLILNSGHQFNLATNIRGDIYHVDNVLSERQPANPSLNYDGFVSRTIPEVKLDWNYPLINETTVGNIIVEPLANAIYSPYGGNASKIPNEDSLDIELSDDNLFNANRFAGLDRVETGPRVNYGLSTTYYNQHDTYLNILLGQAYRFKTDSNFDYGSGLDQKASDYVGRIFFIPNEHLDLAYRFRIDQEELRVKRSELVAFLKYNPFRLQLNYASISDPHHNINEIPRRREEIIASLDIDLTEHWMLNLNGRQNLGSNGGIIKSGWKLHYHSDCVKFDVNYEKDHTRDKNLSNQEKFYITLDLKNLLNLNL